MHHRKSWQLDGDIQYSGGVRRVQCSQGGIPVAYASYLFGTSIMLGTILIGVEPDWMTRHRNPTISRLPSKLSWHRFPLGSDSEDLGNVRVLLWQSPLELA